MKVELKGIPDPTYFLQNTNGFVGGYMKKLVHVAVCLSLIIGLVSCAPSPLRKVDNPNIPFQRPAYSILPPAGGDWAYYSDNCEERYRLNFFKTIPDPKFHSLSAGVVETPNSAVFESPQEFEKWTKKTIEMTTNPNRLHLLEEKVQLDNKFGPFTVKYYTKVEDHKAVNRGNEPFLLLVDYGYIFIHPSNPNLIIQATYSERGRPQEIRPELDREAELFFNNIMIRKASNPDR